MKAPLSYLRKLGIVLAYYIDDLITINKSSVDINRIIELLDSLGFILHPEKSIFEPSQTIEFLGFIINSAEMSLRLTPLKENKSSLKHWKKIQ